MKHRTTHGSSGAAARAQFFAAALAIACVATTDDVAPYRDASPVKSRITITWQ